MILVEGVQQYKGKNWYSLEVEARLLCCKGGQSHFLNAAVASPTRIVSTQSRRVTRLSIHSRPPPLLFSYYIRPLDDLNALPSPKASTPLPMTAWMRGRLCLPAPGATTARPPDDVMPIRAALLFCAVSEGSV